MVPGRLIKFFYLHYKKKKNCAAENFLQHQSNCISTQSFITIDHDKEENAIRVKNKLNFCLITCDLKYRILILRSFIIVFVLNYNFSLS